MRFPWISDRLARNKANETRFSAPFTTTSFSIIRGSRLVRIALVPLTVSLASCSKSKHLESVPDALKQDQNQASPSGSRGSESTNKRSGTSQLDSKEVQDDSKIQQEILESLVTDWNQAITESKGQDLLHRQWAIERRAASLGPGDALLQFFTFLVCNGPNDTKERVISEIGNAIFSSTEAVEYRQWLLTIQDKNLREKLCKFAGKFHPQEGLTDYIKAFAPDTKCQSAVLTGYCRNLTKTDPSGAVRAFMDMIPPNVTFGGLVEVMAVLPPESDFAAISSTLPGDTKNIAKRARAALLQSWTAANPEAAARYVVDNPTLASPEQMGVVVFNWCKQSPETAAGWIDALSPGAPKDHGVAALAKYWTPLDTVKAWEFASIVADHNKKVETATAVFKEWEKTDRAAAERAWVALFPGK